MTKKPKISDFTGNRKEKSRKYNIALRKWRASQKDSSGKRTSYVDILGFKWKKEGDKYVQYRGDGTKTGKTRPYDINANKKNTSRGKRVDPKKVKLNNKKNNKKEPYAKDRVGKVDLKSKAYLEAKRINESITLDDVNKGKPKDTTSGIGPVKDGKKYASELKKGTQGVGPVKDGETYAKNLTKGVKKESKTEGKTEGSGKKESRWIKTRKGTLARRGSVTARAAENRERARKRAQAAAKERLKIKNKKKKKKV